MSDGKPTVALGVLDRILTYADRPWKVFAILLFALVGGLGFATWQERARIADLVLHDPVTRPMLAAPVFVANAGKLLHDTNGDLAVLIELHLEDNQAIDLVGIDRNGVRWVPIEGPQPALLIGSSMANLIRFLRNDVVCANTQTMPSGEGQALAAAGYQRACMVQVPPILGIGVGGLIVAWKAPLTAAAEDRAGLALSAAAMKFATW